MRVLRTIAAYVWLFLATMVCGSLVALIAPFERRGRIWWPIAQVWARGLLLTCGAQPFRVVGAEKIRADRGVILMANHQSHLDPPALIALSGVPVRFLTKHSLFWFPVFGWAMKAMGMVPINRSRRDAAFASIEAAAAMIRAGRTVLVFPEGTRSRTEEMLPFKKGGFVMAAQGQVPIVPVGIAGSRQILPKGFNWVRKGPLVVVIGDPIAPEAYSLENKDELMELVRARIEARRREAWRLYDELAEGEPEVETATA